MKSGEYNHTITFTTKERILTKPMKEAIEKVLQQELLHWAVFVNEWVKDVGIDEVYETRWDCCSCPR